LATCHSSGGHQLRAQEFDVIIIDEATQALEAVRCTLVVIVVVVALTPVAGLLDTYIQVKEAHTRRRSKAASSHDPFTICIKGFRVPKSKPPGIKYRFLHDVIGNLKPCPTE
jgi:hypothetical protein